MPVAFSRFPAMVRTSDGTAVSRSAVVVVDGRALLAIEPPRQHYESGGVQVIATLEDVTVGEPSRRETVLTAADGQTWTVGNGDGCNCRSALSDWFRLQHRGQSMGT